jgi:hypothetical protein
MAAQPASEKFIIASSDGGSFQIALAAIKPQRPGIKQLPKLFLGVLELVADARWDILPQ